MILSSIIIFVPIGLKSHYFCFCSKDFDIILLADWVSRHICKPDYLSIAQENNWNIRPRVLRSEYTSYFYFLSGLSMSKRVSGPLHPCFTLWLTDIRWYMITLFLFCYVTIKLQRLWSGSLNFSVVRTALFHR